MRGAVPCLSADLTTHAVKTLYSAGFENGEACAPRRAKRAAVMSDVSGDAVRGFLAWLFPGLIVAMTAPCARVRCSP